MQSFLLALPSAQSLSNQHFPVGLNGRLQLLIIRQAVIGLLGKGFPNLGAAQKTGPGERSTRVGDASGGSPTQ